MLFMNTLFDENAACHIALGQAYSSCLRDGDTLTPEQLTARGANSSLIHVDWMIGSGQIDVDGITATGNAGARDARRGVGLIAVCSLWVAASAAMSCDVKIKGFGP